MPTIDIGQNAFRLTELPAKCPRCHHAIDPRILTGVAVHFQEYDRAVLEVVFQCPWSECHRAFLGLYSGDWHSSSGYSLQIRGTSPFSPEPPNHSPEVAGISASFVEVFGQAASAEAWDLKEIAGCGYRKALEFLVKDYCISLDPGAAPAIREKFLGRVVDEHVGDVGIKACAKRAAWLGNDETHYVRRWTDMDLTDLKKLIALTESWITTAVRTKDYLAAMEE